MGRSEDSTEEAHAVAALKGSEVSEVSECEY